MHHKRHKTSSRKENKRIEHKSMRMREREVIGGKRGAQPRRMSWAGSPLDIPIVDDVPSTSGRASKRVTPKKERCKINGTHEWYHEWISEDGQDTLGREGYWNCEDCQALRWNIEDGIRYWNRGYCPDHIKIRPYTLHTKWSTCIHCWTAKKKRWPSKEYHDGKGETYSWRGCHNVLKKRPVKFY